MASTSRTPLLGEEPASTGQGAWLGTLRFLLRVINLILAVLGCAIIAYAVYMFVEVKQRPSIHGFPWFIYAFGGAGVLILVTASTALVGVAHNSAFCLGLYSFLMVLLLLAQASLAIAFFADNSWKKKLPHDDTGEAKQMFHFLKHRLNVVRWVGLATLIVQVMSVMLAYALSNGEQQLLNNASDEEDEVWIRRPSLPRAGRSPPAQAVEDPQPHPPRQDPWSQRMRSKYGLDVDQFSYDPTQGDQQAPTLPEPMPEEKGRRCSIM